MSNESSLKKSVETLQENIIKLEKTNASLQEAVTNLSTEVKRLEAVAKPKEIEQEISDDEVEFDTDAFIEEFSEQLYWRLRWPEWNHN